MSKLTSLPDHLPVPLDDGAADHLAGMAVPTIALLATSGEMVDLAGLKSWTVLYVYPMTGHPDRPLPEGWDTIPGARGCTPQSCAFRDHFAELQALGARVFGISTQSTNYQREAKERLHLPFELLSDSDLLLKSALSLPTFSVTGSELYRRLTMIVVDGRIKHVFYPVFPPDRNADEVINWMHNQH
ncbi:MAG TPA: peroxiredoxin [Methylophilaceae bacterium]|nr:peroxiredoxin [Methylophilaceae bacterium]HQR61060.1 peroxiredoxin [Methylophilaceae bacterium]